MINVFNTHAMFSVDNHDVRRRQYDAMRTFVDEQNIQDELVLMVGDFNEDKINTPALYGTMLDDLDAQDFELDPGSTVYSYDPVNNDLIDPESAGAGSVQRALDYILYDDSDDGAIPPGSGSVCQYLTPKDSDGGDLSDHYPMSCDVVLGAKVAVEAASSDSSGSSQPLLGSSNSLGLLSRVALAAALGAILIVFEY
jgi:endonuclease/exonuclease/phosphatase family metal-dependent hydrolase